MPMDIPILWPIYAAVFIVGSGIGSFLNVVIYRVPRGESIVKPGSHCPHCNHAIKPYENIPILSYIFLRGRCSGCQKPISPRYPAVEALMGGLAMLMLWKYGLTREFFIYSALSAVLIALSVIDIQTMRLPNPIVLTGAILALGLNLILRFDFLWQMLAGVLVGLLLMAFMGVVGKLLFRKEALGMGDVKFAAMIGLFVGLWHTLGMFVLGIAVGALVGIATTVISGKDWSRRIPFGPFLALGTILSLLWGKPLWQWYIHLAMR